MHVSWLTIANDKLNLIRKPKKFLENLTFISNSFFWKFLHLLNTSWGTRRCFFLLIPSYTPSHPHHPHNCFYFNPVPPTSAENNISENKFLSLLNTRPYPYNDAHTLKIRKILHSIRHANINCIPFWTEYIYLVFFCYY